MKDKWIHRGTSLKKYYREVKNELHDICGSKVLAYHKEALSIYKDMSLNNLNKLATTGQSLLGICLLDNS